LLHPDDGVLFDGTTQNHPIRSRSADSSVPAQACLEVGRPVIGENLLEMLLGIVDTLLVAGLGVVAIAGVGSGVAHYERRCALSTYYTAHYRPILTFRGANFWHDILMWHCRIAIASFRLEPREMTVNHMIEGQTRNFAFFGSFALLTPALG
jgi:hypothetical protein